MDILVNSVAQGDDWRKVDSVSARDKTIRKLTGGWNLMNTEGTIVFTSDDGGIELRVSVEVAKRQAEIAWRNTIDAEPNMIRVGGCGGKTLLPGYIRSYMASHNIALDFKLAANDFGNKAVFSTEPAEVKATVPVTGVFCE
jgi:hypothetical protein